MRPGRSTGPRFAAWRRVCLAGLASVALLGCTTVRLVSDYDSQIDGGVTQILADTTSFVEKMNGEAGTAAGGYDQNQDFYTTEHGKIVALEARAEANRVLGICPSTELVAKALAAVKVGASAAAYMAAIPKDDCEVVLLSELDAAFTDLKTFHQAQGAKGIPASAHDIILVGGIGTIARVIITVEAGKRAAATGATSHGP